MRRNHILIFCIALIATLPLFAHGCSCGHDFEFHLQSWLDAAQQFRHGALQPHWAFSAAYNAGEPRFIFYPPLSWLFGALLTFLVPLSLVPLLYTFLVLLAAGLAMHHLARAFASQNAALLAATLYLVNPYMLFTAFERTAYAELLAAVWLPLLFLALLRARPTLRGIALPVALLWLTNAPAAVMGCYALALVVIVRILAMLLTHTAPEAARRKEALAAARLAAIAAGGTVLGLALSGFYLVPAAYERRFVQIAMAIIPNMRFQDNFLFGHTGDGPHDAVLHTASLLAIGLLAAALVLLIALFFKLRTRNSHAHAPDEAATPPGTVWICLAALTVCIAFLLTPSSTPLWNHLPELAFLQFPWRLLSVLAVALALMIALLLRSARRTAVMAPIGLILAGLCTFAAIHNFRQSCDVQDLPAARAQLFRAHHGVEPTDEYTPTEADNDVLRADDPPFWLSTNPASFAPGTTPNPATLTTPATSTASTVAIRTPAASLPPSFAPETITVSAAEPEFVILNLRAYPSWHIMVNGHDASPYTGDPRDDGLIVVPVPQGVSTLRIAWRRTLDQQAGLVLSALALLLYLALIVGARSRRIEAGTP